MESFKDVNNEEWKFPQFTYGLVLDIKDETGVDFLGDSTRGQSAESNAGKWFGMLFELETLGDVLSIIFQSEIKARNLDERGFARLMGSESFEQARLGIVGRLLSFSHTPAAVAKIQAELPGIMQKVEVTAIERWSKSVGTSLAGLASTPGPSA